MNGDFFHFELLSSIIWQFFRRYCSYLYVLSEYGFSPTKYRNFSNLFNGEKVETLSKIKYMEENVAVSSEIYKVLASADWGDLGKKMLKRAIWRGSTRYRITSTTIFARGYSLEDVISYIIQSVFDGTRQWNPDEINLEDWLMNQVDSVIDWWLKLKENRNMPHEELENSNSEEDHELNNIKTTELELVLKYGLPTPEKTIETREDDAEAKEIYNALFDATSDDPELQEVLLANMELSDVMEIDQIKPSDLAEKLGVTSGEIYNRNKRLKRRLDKVLTALGKGIL